MENLTISSTLKLYSTLSSSLHALYNIIFEFLKLSSTSAAYLITFLILTLLHFGELRVIKLDANLPTLSIDSVYPILDSSIPARYEKTTPKGRLASIV